MPLDGYVYVFVYILARVTAHYSCD